MCLVCVCVRGGHHGVTRSKHLYFGSTQNVKQMYHLGTGQLALSLNGYLQMIYKGRDSLPHPLSIHLLLILTAPKIKGG